MGLTKNLGWLSKYITADSNGNIGIGITPLSLLHISTPAGTSNNIFRLANSSSSNASNIIRQEFYTGNSFGGLESVASITALNPNAASNNGGALYFSTSANGTGTVPSERVRIINNGNVGIDTPSPSEKLDVNNGRIQARPISNSTTGNAWYMIGSITEVSNFGVANGLVVESEGMNSYAMTLGTQNTYLTGITEKMRISSTGFITTPYQPAFSAFGPSGGASTTSTGAFTLFSQTRTNRGGWYNASNGRFTAPVAGVYDFTFSLLWRQASQSGAGEISIGVNGANIGSRGIAYSVAGASNEFHDQMVVKALLTLNAGDYVTGWIHSNPGNFYYGEGLGYFTGYLIG